MEFSSTKFDTCWILFGSFPGVIYNQNALLMICWSVLCCDRLPTVGNLKYL